VSPVRHAAMTAVGCNTGGKLCPEVERVQRRLESVQSKGAAVVVRVLLSGSPGWIRPCVVVLMSLICSYDGAMTR
jgi:hypothetical protein